MPRLETERLALRLPRPEDEADVREYFYDPEVMRFIGGVDPERSAGDVIRRWLARWEANGVGPFVIERREDGRFLGRAGIVVWDTRTWRNATVAEAGEHAQPELGWMLVRRHWGHGYATEAARAVRDWAYREAGIGPLISLIQPANVASVRVAERLGAAPAETVMLESGVPAVVWRHPGPSSSATGDTPP
jgi:RimJ/RimL family protein N-acetyltransferase